MCTNDKYELCVQMKYVSIFLEKSVKSTSKALEKGVKQCPKQLEKGVKQYSKQLEKGVKSLDFYKKKVYNKENKDAFRT